jgi:hypothetical protein
MSSTVAHLEFENSEITVRATKKTPKIETPGITLNSVKSGNELTTVFWLADELVSHGLAEYTDLSINQTEWTQIHFKERINPAGPPGPLPDQFYEKAYQTFKQAPRYEEEVVLRRIKARYRDILESRIGRIARVASSGAGSPASPLPKHEGRLYDEVHRTVLEWRQKMRSIGE